MDPSSQYQHPTYDPSQFQSQDQSTQAYYEYYNQYQQYYQQQQQQQQQQYPYYGQDYTNPYQQQEPTSIHPPGVPIQPETTHLVGSEQTHFQNSYYPQGLVDNINNPQQHGGYAQAQAQAQAGPMPMHAGARPPIGQSAYRGRGRRGSRSFRGGGRGHSGPRTDDSGATSHGRGRGYAPNSAPGSHHPAPIRPPPRMAWCELCRVDCTTPEILEQHKNGKRHKKNLNVYEELQRLNSLIVKQQNDQVANSEIKPEASDEKKPQQENLSSDENAVKTDNQKVVSGEEESAQEQRMERFGGRGQKRKMRGGRGSNKWVRNSDGSGRPADGSGRPAEPPKPKEIVPLICELCNVKCESPIVFDSHLAGKKHLMNLSRFQEQQLMLGQVALQALLPALQALYPNLEALIQPNPDASTSLAPQFNQEGYVAPQEGPSMIPHDQALAPPSDLKSQERDSEAPGLTSEGGPQNEHELAAKVNVESEDGNEREEVDPPVDNSVSEA